MVNNLLTPHQATCWSVWKRVFALTEGPVSWGTVATDRETYYAVTSKLELGAGRNSSSSRGEEEEYNKKVVKRDNLKRRVRERRGRERRRSCPNCSVWSAVSAPIVGGLSAPSFPTGKVLVETKFEGIEQAAAPTKMHHPHAPQEPLLKSRKSCSLGTFLCMYKCHCPITKHSAFGI